MKQAVQDLFERRQPLAGLAAWCVRQADRTSFSHCYTEWFTATQLERALHRMTAGIQSLGGLDMNPEFLCWIFDRARVYLAVRPDGATLALFAENRPGLPAAEFDSVLKEFIDLTPPR
jgi:hypothetical protein